LPEALADELEQDTGLLIVSVEADSPATKGGLLVGDMVVALDGEATAELDELLSMLTGDRVGKTVPVKIVRGGQLQEITVTIGERM
jgi:S1-C subfamily serine protease